MENNMELYEKLSRLQWLLQRHQLRHRAEHGPLGDSTRGQGRVLALLKMQPEISTRDLSYLLGIRQQSLSELLNKLEKGGYITRRPSETDKRMTIVQLTEKGKKEEHTEKDFSDIFNCLKEDEQATFSEYLDRMIAALEESFSDEIGDEAVEWMREARDRMGHEQFERLRLFSKHRGRGRFGNHRQHFDDFPHDHNPHFDGPNRPHGPHFGRPGKPYDPRFGGPGKPHNPYYGGPDKPHDRNDEKE